MAFADDVLRTYRTLLPRLSSDRSEFDERVAWADVVLTRILGYRHEDGDYDFEQLRVRRDIRVRNAAGDPAIVVETKRSAVTLASEDDVQAFGYTVPATQYVIVTNGTHLRLFRNDAARTRLADLDMVQLARRPLDDGEYRLSLPERTALEHLRYLTRDELYEPRYDDFDGPFMWRKPMQQEDAFADMLADLEKCVGYLYLHALHAFDHFVAEARRVEEDVTNRDREATALYAAGDFVGAARLALEVRRKRASAAAFLQFNDDFVLWRRLSNREDKSPETNKDVFCKESVYVQLNKLLFVRICEDKRLLTRKVSNGGVRVWRDFTTHLRDSYRDLIALAFTDATHLYEHLFAEGVFDWYLAGNGSLNDTLNRVLWRLNLYDFGAVDRDILGKLYERYFPRDVRKTLGEFYTHEVVVDFILDRVGYTDDRDLRNVQLLDPACGSGTFPVRALGRLLRSLSRMGLPATERIRQATENFTGFDINPFACAIAEMNLAFQLIGDYANSGDRAGAVPRIAIYQTDSLLPPQTERGAVQQDTQLLMGAGMLAPGSSTLIAERDATDERKQRRYDVIVGNPPYVVTTDKVYRDTYRDIVQGGTNTYRYFLRAYLPLLKEGGRLGFIVPNTWLADEDSAAFRAWLLAHYRLELVLYLPYYVRAFYRVDQATTILVARPKTNADGNAYELTVGEARSLDELTGRTYRAVATTLDEVIAHDERYGLHHSLTIQPVPGAYAVLRRIRDAGFPTLVPHLVTKMYNGELGQPERRRITSSPGADKAVSLRGQNIGPYFIDTTNERKRAQWYDLRVTIERDGHAQQKRLVIMSRARQTQVKRIKCGLLDPATAPNERVYCDSRGMNYILTGDVRVSTEYVEGVLNSAPANFYFKAYSASNQVNSADLARLPVPLPNAENAEPVAHVVEAVRRMHALHRERDNARAAIAAPLAAVPEVDLVPLTQSPHVTGFPGTNTVGNNPMVVGAQVVTGSGTFTCTDANAARLLALALRELPLTATLADVRFPRDGAALHAALETHDAAQAVIAAFSGQYARLEREIDGHAYTLYGIADARATIEASLRTARVNEPDDDDDADA